MRWRLSSLCPRSWGRPVARRRHARPCLNVERLEPRALLSADVLTWHNDNARTGLDPNETQLAPANVNVNTFGLRFILPADGKVDAALLYKAGVVIPGQGTHNVAFLASEHDTVYAYDADNGQLLWRARLLGPGEVPSDPRGCGQVTPEIGITATPVIDPGTNIMYVVAMSKRVSGGTTYFQRLHALDVGTGQDVLPPASIDSSISVPGMGPGGDGTNVFFDPAQYKERDALLLVNGKIITSWASHCDIAPYTGWVMAFNAADLSLTSVLNVNPNGVPNSQFLGDGSGNAFWNSGAGPAADAAGNVYNISGNGPFDENLDANGFPVSQDYGDTYLKLAFDGSGNLGVADYWTPYNQQYLADHDLDVGSSGTLLLPDMTDATGQVRHLAIGSGKDGNLYLVDRDNMGRFVAGSNSTLYQEVPGAIGAEFSAPAYFNGQVYFGGVNDFLKAFPLTNALLGTSPSSQTGNSFGYPGATPSVSSNGSANGIVWAAENGSTAVLHAYDASDLSVELYNSNQAGARDHFGVGNKFITPVIADGKVFVGTTTGVGAFGLLPPAVHRAGAGAALPASVHRPGARPEGLRLVPAADRLGGGTPVVGGGGHRAELDASPALDLTFLATALTGHQPGPSVGVTNYETDVSAPGSPPGLALPGNFSMVALPGGSAAGGAPTWEAHGHGPPGRAPQDGSGAGLGMPQDGGSDLGLLALDGSCYS
jgi:hypothetical protein